MTEVAEAVIGCVEDCRQRYGVNVILDTVRGSLHCEDQAVPDGRECLVREA